MNTSDQLHLDNGLCLSVVHNTLSPSNDVFSQFHTPISHILFMIQMLPISSQVQSYSSQVRLGVRLRRFVSSFVYKATFLHTGSHPILSYNVEFSSPFSSFLFQRMHSCQITEKTILTFVYTGLPSKYKVPKTS